MGAWIAAVIVLPVAGIALAVLIVLLYRQNRAALKEKQRKKKQAQDVEAQAVMEKQRNSRKTHKQEESRSTLAGKQSRRQSLMEYLHVAPRAGTHRDSYDASAPRLSLNLNRTSSLLTNKLMNSLHGRPASGHRELDESNYDRHLKEARHQRAHKERRGTDRRFADDRPTMRQVHESQINGRSPLERQASRVDIAANVPAGAVSLSSVPRTDVSLSSIQRRSSSLTHHSIEDSESRASSKRSRRQLKQSLKKPLPERPIEEAPAYSTSVYAQQEEKAIMNRENISHRDNLGSHHNGSSLSSSHKTHESGSPLLSPSQRYSGSHYSGDSIIASPSPAYTSPNNTSATTTSNNHIYQFQHPTSLKADSLSSHKSSASMLPQSQQPMAPPFPLPVAPLAPHSTSDVPARSPYRLSGSMDALTNGSSLSHFVTARTDSGQASGSDRQQSSQSIQSPASFASSMITAKSYQSVDSLTRIQQQLLEPDVPPMPSMESLQHGKVGAGSVHSSPVQNTASGGGVVAMLGGELHDVIFPYKAQLSDELELGKGDRVMVYSVFDDGWCYARLCSRSRNNGSRARSFDGICPKACLQKSQ